MGYITIIIHNGAILIHPALCLSRLYLPITTLDSFTVSLHNPNGRQICLPLGLCKGTVSGLWILRLWKQPVSGFWNMVEIPTSHKPIIHCTLSIIQGRPCLLLHWESFSHHTKTVYQSITTQRAHIHHRAMGKQYSKNYQWYTCGASTQKSNKLAPCLIPCAIFYILARSYPVRGQGLTTP